MGGGKEGVDAVLEHLFAFDTTFRLQVLADQVEPSVRLLAENELPRPCPGRPLPSCAHSRTLPLLDSCKAQNILPGGHSRWHGIHNMTHCCVRPRRRSGGHHQRVASGGENAPACQRWQPR